jgi:hypothetical protein
MRTAGSYYRNDRFRSVSGLGDDASLSLADQGLLALVQPTPSVTYTEWASQSGDVTWTEQTPVNNYQAWAILDQQLVSVAATALSVPTTLCVISPVLTFSTTVGKAFESTPYAYQKTEAIYSQIDPRQPPQIFFLYWLTLRSAADPKLGNVSLNFGATSVGGVLSYVLEVPASSSDRARPTLSFNSALQAQQSAGPISIPQTPASASTLPIPSSTPASSLPGLPGVSIQPAVPGSAAPVVAASATAQDTTKAVLIVGLAAAAAVGAYKLYTSRKSA